MNLVRVAYLSPEWRAYRRTRITASTAAAVLGYGGPYRSPLSEWARLRGADPEPESTNPYAEWGIASEAAHRAWISGEDAGEVWTQEGIVQHTEYSWACCTPDGFLGTEPSLCVVETKAPSQYTADEWRGALPLKYQIQAQFAMSCCNAETAYLSAVLTPERDPGGAFVRLAAALTTGESMTPALLQRCGFERVGHMLRADSRFQSAMFAKLAQFMEQNVAQGYAPEAGPLPVDKALLRGMGKTPLNLDLSVEAAAKWDELQAVNADVAARSERKEELQNQLTQAVNAATWMEAKKAIQSVRRNT